MRRDAEGIVFGGVTALAAMLAVVGLALLPLLAPPVVRAVAGDRELEARTMVSRERALEAAELVRVYVTTPSPRRLPVSYYGRDAFDERAAAHLDDVRGVVLGGLAAAALSCLVLAAAFALAARRGRVADAASGMRAGGRAVLVIMALCAAVAAVSFEAAFTAFHALFFDPGTWTFAVDDLLILLFPTRFWVTMGASWATLASALAVACLFAARRLERGATLRHAGVVVGDVYTDCGETRGDPTDH